MTGQTSPAGAAVIALLALAVENLWRRTAYIRAAGQPLPTSSTTGTSAFDGRAHGERLCFALGSKAWLFAGSERGTERAAVKATLVVTAKLNDVNTPAWLVDLLARIADTPVQRLAELLLWYWRSPFPKVGESNIAA